MPYLLSIQKEDEVNRFENILTEDTPVEWFTKNPHRVLISSWGLSERKYYALIEAVIKNIEVKDAS